MMKAVTVKACSITQGGKTKHITRTFRTEIFTGINNTNGIKNVNLHIVHIVVFT